METTLYRKYRPAKFSEVLGQEHVTSVIRGSLENKRIAHAYLFAGPRGTGKTSVARIVAKDLETSAHDIYEIDGASNRGIDEIRALKEGVNTLPFDSKYKVYIIDEVHMLTKEAFNALLKTLEEPPAHALFILATTESHKVPETIVSRCQVHLFRRPTQEVLAKLLVSAARKEGLVLDKESAALIALLADGSFRDAYGILQKVISSVDGEAIIAEDVQRVTGAPRAELVRSLVRAVVGKDLNTALLVVSKAREENIDMKTYLKLLMRELRTALLMRFSSDMKKHLTEELSDDELKFQKEIEGAVGKEIKSDLLRELIDVYEQTDRSHVPELPLELALIKILSNTS